jgi:hypothetical protein
MKLSRRDKSADADPESVSADSVVDDAPAVSTSKGRPTPKRRDAQGRRGPVTAPTTRKEAYARQREVAKQQKSTAKSSSKTRSVAEQRAALRAGDPSVLPRRDQGKTRQLARDYVDSKRMLSNYLLWLFPVMIAGIAVPLFQLVVLFVFIALLVEWYIVGKRIRALAMERFGEAQGGNMSIGFYAGSRAYMPRRWRLPGPRLERGDPI